MKFTARAANFSRKQGTRAAQNAQTDQWWLLPFTCHGKLGVKEKLAERGGFEPPIRFYSYNGLANRRFRPLSHLSAQSRQTRQPLRVYRALAQVPGANAEKLIVANVGWVK